MCHPEEQMQFSDWKKQIILFLASQNISFFGSSVVAYAILWHITLTTSSGVWIMLITIASMGPQLVISLFGGVWADRHNRKTLIMLSDGFIATATLLLALTFLFGYDGLELVLAVSVIRSIGSGVQMPAVNAITPQLVPPEQLTKIQGINQTLNSILTLLSPVVGGLLLGSVGLVFAFFVDVATAALAILVMSRIPIKKPVRTDAEVSVWKDLQSGLNYTFRHAQLKRILIYYLFGFFLFTPAATLLPLMVERNFGNEIWRLTAVEVVWTVGSLIGGLFVSIKGQFQNKVQTVAIALIGFGIFFGLMGVVGPFPLLVALMAGAGFFMPIFVTVQTVYIQEITEPEVLGRVFSIIQIISGSAMPAAILFFGPLADIVSIEIILVVTGALLTVVGLMYGWHTKRIVS